MVLCPTRAVVRVGTVLFHLPLVIPSNLIFHSTRRASNKPVRSCKLYDQANRQVVQPVLAAGAEEEGVYGNKERYDNFSQQMREGNISGGAGGGSACISRSGGTSRGRWCGSTAPALPSFSSTRAVLAPAALPVLVLGWLLAPSSKLQAILANFAGRRFSVFLVQF